MSVVVATGTEIRNVIVKKADDPLGIVRVSIGGTFGSYYCVYRGSKDQAVKAIESVLTGMRAMVEHLGPDEEPDTQPDDDDVGQAVPPPAPTKGIT